MRKTYPRFPKQAEKIYKLLLAKNKPLTAYQIAEKFNIFPNAVYRDIYKLEKYNLVQKSPTRPMRFNALQPKEGLETFLLSHRNWFSESFVGNSLTSNYQSDPSLDLSFIRDRNDSVYRSTQDLKQAKVQVLQIVSGLELPADTMLEIKNAIDRGVTIKIIVQTLSENNRELLENWKRLGVKLKSTKSISSRLILIDNHITYLMSYNPDQESENIGIRFNYRPITTLMQEIFEKRWQSAKMI